MNWVDNFNRIRESTPNDNIYANYHNFRSVLIQYYNYLVNLMILQSYTYICIFNSSIHILLVYKDDCISDGTQLFIIILINLKDA